MKEAQKKSKSLLVTLVICITVVIVSIVGGLIYMQKQQITQRNLELKQKQEADKKKSDEDLKRLKFQECEATKRAKSDDNPYSTFGNSFNCELKL